MSTGEGECQEDTGGSFRSGLPASWSCHARLQTCELPPLQHSVRSSRKYCTNLPWWCTIYPVSQVGITAGRTANVQSKQRTACVAAFSAIQPSCAVATFSWARSTWWISAVWTICFTHHLGLSLKRWAIMVETRHSPATLIAPRLASPVDQKTACSTLQ